MKKSRRDMCCILGIKFIFRLAFHSREFPTLVPRINAIKSKGDWCMGSQDIIRLYGIIRGSAVVVIDLYPLMTECGHFILHHSYPMTSWSEDGQESLFVFLVSEPVYPLLWWDHWWSYGGLKERYLQIEKVFFGGFLCCMHHPLGGIEFLFCEIFMTYDE